MTEERKCPECGQSEHYYPKAVPTGRLTEDGLIQLKIGEGGHCLHCGYDSDPPDDEREPA